jgi:hypothetical protein
LKLDKPKPRNKVTKAKPNNRFITSGVLSIL